MNIMDLNCLSEREVKVLLVVLGPDAKVEDITGNTIELCGFSNELHEAIIRDFSAWIEKLSIEREACDALSVQHKLEAHTKFLEEAKSFMTVAQLIEKLQEMSQDLIVSFQGWQDADQEISFVEEVKGSTMIYATGIETLNRVRLS